MRVTGRPAAKRLLGWYAPRRRAYPWRVSPTPYRVLVSEVMLQQTQASRVVPAFRRFVRRFPSVAALAAAARSDVLREWAGLGYNRRAVALSRAARQIAREHDGRIPRDPAELARLPGVGPYTASAVASIAFGDPVPALDTNARRVTARVLLGVEPEDAPADDLASAARRWLDRRDPAAWNQALMDLGRVICRPAPRCDACPVARECRSSFAERRLGRGRGHERFEGSMRQLRGRVVAVLRERGSGSVGWLSRSLSERPDRIAAALAGLARHGVVDAGPAALRGRPGGRASLPEERRDGWSRSNRGRQPRGEAAGADRWMRR